jgi:hypothetical protein
VLLAETISIDAGDVALILIALALMVLATVAVIVFGFKWAAGAGRGSQRALVGFVIVIGLEAMLVAPAIMAMINARNVSLIALAVPAIPVAQLVVFFRTRGEARGQPPPPDGPGPPTPPAPPAPG